MTQLTIIMPAYNAAAFIGEAIGSLMNQTYADFELWVADDGSTDDTAAIVKSFDDPRITLHMAPVNVGRVQTVNRLVGQIATPYFTITDADDVAHPKKLEKQITLLAGDPTLMMCGTSYWAMNERGYLVRPMRLRTELSELRAEALRQSQFLGPTTVMRREVIAAFPDFYRAYFIDHFADADLSSRVLDKFPATNLPELLYFYRIVRTSVTRKQVTIRKLNLHRLVGELSRQRRALGTDCLDRQLPEEADAFIHAVTLAYERDPSLYPRHQAFFYLYWGLSDLAITKARQAVRVRPLQIKNVLSFFLVVVRGFFTWFRQNVFRTHVGEMIEEV